MLKFIWIIRIEVGGMKLDLYNVVFVIFKICMLLRIFLEVCWILRYENVIVDFFSKMYDVDDCWWGIDGRIFKLFNRKLGLFMCDLFVNFFNFKVKKFYLKFVDGLLIGIDVFLFGWKFDNNWIVLLVILYVISRVIFYLIVCKVIGVFFVLKWIFFLCWLCIVNNDGILKMLLKNV